MSEVGFELWLEFEICQEAEVGDLEDEFCNIEILLSDGRTYALNIWTFKFFERARQDCQGSGENMTGKYLLPPDLFVRKLERKLITEVVADLLRNNELKDEWLVHEFE
jgi:hypothetical protein